MNDSRLLDCASPAEIEANLVRMMAIADAKQGFGTAVNAVAAAGTLTFSGVVADAQTVTIGSEVYEFKTSGDAAEGNIKVDVAGGVTAPAAVTALVAAITGHTASVVTAVDGAGDTVVVTAKVKGVSGNAIATTETCTNGSWGAAHLASGVDGTVGVKGAILVDADKIYIATDVNTIADANWKYAALT